MERPLHHYISRGNGIIPIPPPRHELHTKGKRDDRDREDKGRGRERRADSRDGAEDGRDVETAHAPPRRPVTLQGVAAGACVTSCDEEEARSTKKRVSRRVSSGPATTAARHSGCCCYVLRVVLQLLLYVNRTPIEQCSESIECCTARCQSSSRAAAQSGIAQAMSRCRCCCASVLLLLLLPCHDWLMTCVCHHIHWQQLSSSQSNSSPHSAQHETAAVDVDHPLSAYPEHPSTRQMDAAQSLILPTAHPWPAAFLGDGLHRARSLLPLELSQRARATLSPLHGRCPRPDTGRCWHFLQLPLRHSFLYHGQSSTLTSC